MSKSQIYQIHFGLMISLIDKILKMMDFIITKVLQKQILYKAKKRTFTKIIFRENNND